MYVNEFGNRSGGDNRITLVDPVTGAQTTIVKGGIFAVGAGQLGGIVIDRNGNILSADCLPTNFIGCVGRIISTDPITGNQTVIFSQNNLRLKGIVLDSLGNAFVVDEGDRAVDSSKVIHVDLATGSYEVVSSGGNLTNPWGIAIDASGNLVVANRQNFFGDPSTSNTIIKIDPVTGEQSILSEDGLFVTPQTLAIAVNGDIFVADPGLNAAGRVFRVDPATGDQSIVFPRPVPFELNPPSFSDHVNLRKRDMSLAIMSTSTFDVNAVNTSTTTFWFPRTGSNSAGTRLPESHTFRDVNKDRLPDLLRQADYMAAHRKWI